MCTKGCPWLVTSSICHVRAHLVLRNKGRPGPYSNVSAIYAILVRKEPKRPGSQAWLCHSLM